MPVKRLTQTGTATRPASLLKSLSLRRQVSAPCRGWEGTSEAEGVVPGQRVGEARLVVVLVQGPDARRVPPAGGAGAHDGVAQAAVGQPARVAPVQALLPGGVELANGGQRGVLALTVLLGFWEGELLRLRCEEHIAWGMGEKNE